MLILEGLVTTRNADGSPQVSPMGPGVSAGFTQLVLRPFRTSRTYENLRRQGEGVFHVTDDVELLAQAAVGRLTEPPRFLPAPGVAGFVLADACRWYAFRVVSRDDQPERTTMDCRVVEQGWIRDFLGFNRAKHAVIEAAILATRVHLLAADELATQWRALAPLVEKTGGPAERRAFALLAQYVQECRDRPATSR